MTRKDSIVLGIILGVVAMIAAFTLATIADRNGKRLLEDEKDTDIKECGC